MGDWLATLRLSFCPCPCGSGRFLTLILHLTSSICFTSQQHFFKNN